MAPIRSSWQDLMKMRLKGDCQPRSGVEVPKDTPTRNTLLLVATARSETSLPALHDSRQAPSEVLTSHGTNHKVFAELRGFRGDVTVQAQPRATSSVGFHSHCESAPNNVVQKPANAEHVSPVLNLHWLLKTANPLWTAAEFKAAKRKLKLVGITTYSEMEESLQGKGVLNNRLREQGLKAFAPATLERLRSIVNSEQERRRQAAILQLQRALRNESYLDQKATRDIEKQVETGAPIELHNDEAARVRSGQQWYSRRAAYSQKRSVEEVVSHGQGKDCQDTWYDTDSTGDEGPGCSSLGSSAPESPSGTRRTSCAATVYLIGTP